MKKLVRNLFLLIPAIISCQQFPSEDLKQLGVTQEEITKSISLNGKNGVNGHYLLQRIKCEGKPDDPIRFCEWRFELYTPEGELIPITQFSDQTNHLVHFEILGGEIVLIETIFPFFYKVRASKFDITTHKLTSMAEGEIPCKDKNDCTWISYERRKFAFNKGLSIYVFNWQTEEIKSIAENIPSGIDAFSGRNLLLTRTKYNESKNEFEYGL